LIRVEIPILRYFSPNNQKEPLFQNRLNMHVRQLLTFFAAFLTLGSLTAQDIHFTQYNMSPMTLNPGNIGRFEGTVRLGGIYRGQWASVIGSGSQYKTPSFWADAPIVRGFRKQDWLGVGLVFINDKAGVAGLKTTGAKLGATYHLAVNKKGTTAISLGVQYGRMGRGINRDELRYADGLLASQGGTYNSSLSDDYDLTAQDNVNYTDIDAGLVLSSRLNKTMDFNVGFAMFHINQPDFGLISAGGGGGMGGGTGGAGTDLVRRAVFHGQFNAALTDKFTISPTFLYQTISGADEIAVQAMGGYLFDEERDITLNFGLGYRLGDALQALVGAKYKDLRIGLAYDINTSDLNSASNYRGGFEIAANYIVKIYKAPVTKTKILCPRF